LVPPESGLTHFKKDGSRLNKPCEQSHGDIAEKARVQGAFARSLGEAGCATLPGGSFKSRICGHSMGNPCLSKTKQPRHCQPKLLRAFHAGPDCEPWGGLQIRQSKGTISHDPWQAPGSSGSVTPVSSLRECPPSALMRQIGWV